MAELSCRDCAVKLLSFKDRTEKELRDRLAEKGYPAAEIEETVEAMKAFGYINDRSYAERYIADAMKLRRLGEHRVRRELLSRGIERDLADELFASLEDDAAERIAAEIGRRFSGADLGNPKERNRVFGYFARRGFSYEDIKSALNRESAFGDIEWED